MQESSIFSHKLYLCSLLIFVFYYSIQAENDVAVDLRDELECPVCKDYWTRPRECVACGRVFCGPCVAHLASCPLCRKDPFVSRESRLASRLVENVRVKCEQCETKLARSRLEEHKKICPKRLRKCSFKDCGFFATDNEDAMAHLSRVHVDQICANFEQLPRVMCPGNTCVYLFRIYK